MTTTTRPRFYSMAEVEAHNRRTNHHFFDESSKRFFRSRISDILYGGRYFVTSEQGPDNIRRYTVREAMPDGSIESVPAFQHYASYSGAHAAARRLGEGS